MKSRPFFSELKRAVLKVAARRDPWPLPLVLKHSIAVTEHIAGQNPSLYHALEEPFCVYASESMTWKKRAAPSS